MILDDFGQSGVVTLAKSSKSTKRSKRLFQQGSLQEDLDVEAFPIALESEAQVIPGGGQASQAFHAKAEGQCMSLNCRYLYIWYTYKVIISVYLPTPHLFISCLYRVWVYMYIYLSLSLSLSNLHGCAGLVHPSPKTKGNHTVLVDLEEGRLSTLF